MLFLWLYVAGEIPLITISQEKFAHWAVPHFGRLVKAAQQSVAWLLNRPGIQEMRAMDQDFYVVLAIQSWQRGPPFLPAEAFNGSK